MSLHVLYEKIMPEGINNASYFSVSPEFLLNQPFDTRADIWSVGCLTIELLTGEPPFFRETHGSIAALRQMFIEKAIPQLPVPKDTDCGRFLRKCLQYAPSDRYSLMDLQSDPFVWDLDSSLHLPVIPEEDERLPEIDLREKGSPRKVKRFPQKLAEMGSNNFDSIESGKWQIERKPSLKVHSLTNKIPPEVDAFRIHQRSHKDLGSETNLIKNPPGSEKVKVKEGSQADDDDYLETVDLGKRGNDSLEKSNEGLPTARQESNTKYKSRLVDASHLIKNPGMFQGQGSGEQSKSDSKLEHLSVQSSDRSSKSKNGDSEPNLKELEAAQDLLMQQILAELNSGPVSEPKKQKEESVQVEPEETKSELSRKQAAIMKEIMEELARQQEFPDKEKPIDKIGNDLEIMSVGTPINAQPIRFFSNQQKNEGIDTKTKDQEEEIIKGPKSEKYLENIERKSNIFFSGNPKDKSISTFNMDKPDQQFNEDDLPPLEESLSKTPFHRPPTGKLKKDNSRSDHGLQTGKMSEKASLSAREGHQSKFNFSSKLPSYMLQKFTSPRKLPTAKDLSQSHRHESNTLLELSQREAKTVTLPDREKVDKEKTEKESEKMPERRQSKQSAGKSPSSIQSNARVFGQTKESESLKSRPLDTLEKRPKKLNLKQDSEMESLVPQKEKSKKKLRPYESVQKTSVKFDLHSSLKRPRQFSFVHNDSIQSSSSEGSPEKVETSKKKPVYVDAPNLIFNGG